MLKYQDYLNIRWFCTWKDFIPWIVEQEHVNVDKLKKQQIETTQHKSNIYRRDGDKSETKWPEYI